ncbi:MAG: hypothetical protein Q9213_000678 [Squamulea squamosa]
MSADTHTVAVQSTLVNQVMSKPSNKMNSVLLGRKDPSSCFIVADHNDPPMIIEFAQGLAKIAILVEIRHELEPKNEQYMTIHRAIQRFNAGYYGGLQYDDDDGPELARKDNALLGDVRAIAAVCHRLRSRNMQLGEELQEVMRKAVEALKGFGEDDKRFSFWLEHEG